MKFTAVIAWFSVIYTQGALAAVITNLDETPRVIQKEEGGGFVPQEIKAGETFRVAGALKIRYNGRELRIDADEEYAIWKDGTLGPQKRLKNFFE